MKTAMRESSFECYLERKRKTINRFLEKYLGVDRRTPAGIQEAMRYAVLGNGKRIRPILSLASAEACSLDSSKIITTCCAIEFIHNYSLIHDDLPAMDNDDFRRGKPTVHKKFGEETAILAGDALLTKAFYLLSREKKLPAVSVIRVIELVSLAAGVSCMIGGQAADILVNRGKNAQAKGRKAKALLDYIYRNKTSALIEASVLSPAVLAGAGPGQLNALRDYARNTGFAFQLADDILDAGKKEFGYVSVYGIEDSSQKVLELAEGAKKSLKVFGSKALRLNQLADFIATREY